MEESKENQKDQLEIIDWDPGVRGVKPVKLVELKDPKDQAPGGFAIPIVIVAMAEVQEDLQRQVVKSLSEAGSAKEIVAANFLAEQLGFMASQADCIAAVKKIRRLRSVGGSGRGMASKRILIPLRQAYWSSEKDFEGLKNVPGVYRLDDPGSTRRSIETAIEWPDNVSKHDPDIDNWMKQVGESGLDAKEAAGKLISMGSRPASTPPAPQRPKITRGK